MNSLLPRLINTNPSPRVGMVPNIYQRAVYKHGQLYAPGLEGGMPSWVYAEMLLEAQATDDTTLALPTAFNLLSFSGLSYLTTGGVPSGGNGVFRVQIYDVNGQRDLIPGKAVNIDNICGNQGHVAFLPEPYFFEGDEPSVQLRLSNQSTQQSLVQFVLYGSQGVYPS
jgi:hypothetical protein